MKTITEKIRENRGTVALISLLIIFAGALYFNNKAKTISPDTTSVINDSNPLLKTYTNNKYGFAFEYPATWNLVESENEASLKINSGISSGQNGPQSAPIDTLVININVINYKDFGMVPTKVGTIEYSTTTNNLIDSSSKPVRCLPEQYQIGVLSHSTTTIPFISYGGSMMSDPAWGVSAVLTNKDYLISINTAKEPLNDAIKDAEINSLESGIYSSFKLINGVEARVPNCSENKNSIKQI